MIPSCILAIENEDDREFMIFVYEEYKRLMYSTTQKVLSNHWDIEDVMGNVLEKLIDKLQTLRSLTRDRRVNYIISACTYTAYNFKRDNKSQRETPYEDALLADDEAMKECEIEWEIIKDEQLKALERVMSKLDIRTRCLLEGYYILEKPMKELAKDLGIKPGSIRMALTRARRRAFTMLQKELGADPVEER